MRQERQQNSSGFHITWWCKSYTDHLRGIAKYWKSSLLLLLTVSTGVWAILAPLLTRFGLLIPPILAFSAAIATGVISAITSTFLRYRDECPEGLEDEPVDVRRLAVYQRPGWEFRLMKRLLEDRLSALDEELRVLLEGEAFVPVEKRLSLPEYTEWMQRRINNIQRMSKVAAGLIEHRFLRSLSGDPEEPPQPRDVVADVDRMSEFYEQTVDFERKAHSIAPPEGFNRLHELQKAWTAPIREAIQQLSELLEDLSNPNNLKDLDGLHIRFECVFDEPPKLKEFLDELDRLDGSMVTDPRQMHE
jgi:hypothetical protein